VEGVTVNVFVLVVFLTQAQMPMNKIQEILERDDKAELRALFSFDSSNTEEEVLLKFNLWGRKLFPKFYKHTDSDFHKEIDQYNYRVYSGKPIKRSNDIISAIKFFIDIVFRGGAKTTRTKLFLAFCISNDLDHKRKYIKILSDDDNSKQVVTDIYNLLISISRIYPEIFQKTDFKKEERMDSFTTFTGIKMKASTLGKSQRGQIQEEARPDLIWFDDFETRITLRSLVKTKAIWDNMEEAKNGLSKDGGAIYTCNYVSERGNVHKLVLKKNNPNTKVLIVPIKYKEKTMWSYYTMADINALEIDADDFAGEYMCEPAAGLNVFFDRDSLNRQTTKQATKEIAGFKMFYPYNPSHRYGGAMDVAGGVGIDHSTSVFIDFSTTPNRVVATFASNLIKPDDFGDEIASEARRYGEPIVAPENNKFDMCIGRLKQIYDNIYFTETKETRVGLDPRTKTLGWNTNRMTKPQMLMDVKGAIADGHLELTDEDLVAEFMAYTRDDLMDKEDDVRLTTNHFDLLIACAIAWQMRNWATVKTEEEGYQQAPYETPISD